MRHPVVPLIDYHLNHQYQDIIERTNDFIEDIENQFNAPLDQSLREEHNGEYLYFKDVLEQLYFLQKESSLKFKFLYHGSIRLDDIVLSPPKIMAKIPQIFSDDSSKQANKQKYYKDAMRKLLDDNYDQLTLN